MAVSTPICNFGWPAPDFRLPDLDGNKYSYTDIAGPNGTLIMFISNHCPYVKAIETRIARDVKALQELGIGVAAICSNDEISYPDDGPAGMAEQVARAGFTFPYLHDATQEVARAYDAVCTPDFFGFDKQGGLQYRGRLDASKRDTAPPDAPRELFEAMRAVAQTGRGPQQQVPSMGCSIKWKPDAG
ncbi:MAG TPA: thioredoxin family protein [Hellea balneolensis]|uniref:Thioredoxin family protein n=1 Tax=Hellea balneolensis TaxID=287478 RepID=A0A7C5R394_9PROT|nr:thioredoxin family protein [Hellea balneolensis]